MTIIRPQAKQEEFLSNPADIVIYTGVRQEEEKHGHSCMNPSDM